MTTDNQIAAQRTCPLFTDHTWISGRLLSTARDPTRGYYHRVEVRCSRCGKTAVETRWVGLPPTLPPFDPTGPLTR